MSKNSKRSKAQALCDTWWFKLADKSSIQRTCSGHAHVVDFSHLFRAHYFDYFSEALFNEVTI